MHSLNPLTVLLCHVQAARAAAEPADAQQQQAVIQRLEEKVKSLQQEVTEQESRVVQSEQHKQLLRESLHVSGYCYEAAHLEILTSPVHHTHVAYAVRLLHKSKDIPKCVNLAA